MAGVVIAGPAAGHVVQGDPMRATVHVMPRFSYSGDTSRANADPKTFRSSHVVVRNDIAVGKEVRAVYVPDGMLLADAFDELLRRAFGKVPL